MKQCAIQTDIRFLSHQVLHHAVGKSACCSYCPIAINRNDCGISDFSPKTSQCWTRFLLTFPVGSFFVFRVKKSNCCTPFSRAKRWSFIWEGSTTNTLVSPDVAVLSRAARYCDQLCKSRTLNSVTERVGRNRTGKSWWRLA